jgi:hypothetical protein
MSKTVHSVKLQAYASVDLDRISYSGGDVVYDKTNGTLRVMDGETPGGGKLATQVWVQNSAGTITANLKGDIYTAGGLRVLDNGTTLANPAFFGDIYASNGTSKILDNGTDGTNAAFTGSVTGNLTGNVTGNLTGNVTGNVTGAVTGNASTATQLATARNINGVAFNGSVNITLNTLVNGANTVSLGSTGITTFPGVINAGNIKNLVVNDLGGGTSLTVGSQIQIGNSAGAGAGVLIKNAVTNTLGGETSLEAGSKIQMDDGNVSLISYTYNSLGGGSGLEGQLVVEVDNSYLNNVVRIGTRVINTTGGTPTSVFQGVTISQYGNISTPTGTVTASAVTTANDVTVGGNAVISTAPTLITHATNKQYVDKKATAMAIALS